MTITDGEHLFVPGYEEQQEWYNDAKSAGAAYLLITADYFFQCDYGPRTVKNRNSIFGTIAQYHKPENDDIVVESISLNDDYRLQITNKLMCDSENSWDKPVSFESFGDALDRLGHPNFSRGLPGTPSFNDLYVWYEQGLFDKRRFLLIVEHRTPEAEYFPLYIPDKLNLFAAIKALQGKNDCYVNEVYNIRFDFLHQWKVKSLSIYEPDVNCNERIEQNVNELI